MLKTEQFRSDKVAERIRLYVSIVINRDMIKTITLQILKTPAKIFVTISCEFALDIRARYD